MCVCSCFAIWYVLWLFTCVFWTAGPSISYARHFLSRFSYVRCTIEFFVKFKGCCLYVAKWMSGTHYPTKLVVKQIRVAYLSISHKNKGLEFSSNLVYLLIFIGTMGYFSTFFKNALFVAMSTYQVIRLWSSQ